MGTIRYIIKRRELVQCGLSARSWSPWTAIRQPLFTERVKAEAYCERYGLLRAYGAQATGSEFAVFAESAGAA